MDQLLPHGGFVRLQSRGRPGDYVHADGDWEGVSLRPLALGTAASSLDAVWWVERLAANQQAQAQEAGIFVQLQNAAYGRYLSFWFARARRGHRGYLAVQSDRYDAPDTVLDAYELWWRVARVHPNQDYVRLRCADSNFDLRANGKRRWWKTGVTVDENRRQRLTTMMQWTVHVVPESPVPLPLLLPDAPPQPQQVAPPQPQQQQGGLRGLLFWWRSGNNGLGVHQHPARTIWHVRASDEGDFDQNRHNWASVDSHDNSVFNLRAQLGLLQHYRNEVEDMNAYTLCMRPGSHGLLIPLVTDLPRSLHAVFIVVFRTGSQGAADLVYPQIDAQAQ